MNICVFGAASEKIDDIYKETAELLGEKLARKNHTVVFGGGKYGVMGALARGATKENGKLISVATNFFKDAGVLYEKCFKFYYAETMRERKQLLESNSNAFIAAPGGMGTFEEFLEILTLKQLGQTNKALAIYNVNHYYDDLISFLNKAVNDHFMDEEDMSLFYVSDNIDDIIEYIENYEAPEFHVNKLQGRG